MQFNVKEKKFLEEGLDFLYKNLTKIFDNIVSFDMFDVLMQVMAQGKEKVKEILDLLKKNFNKDLEYQYPDVELYNIFGVNETKLMFLDICEKSL